MSQAGRVAILCLSFALSGCSWFEDKPAPAAAGPEAGGANTGVPSVNSVPNQRPRSSLINLESLGGGLGSDSGHAAYSGELIPVLPSVPRPEPAPPPAPAAATPEGGEAATNEAAPETGEAAAPAEANPPAAPDATAAPDASAAPAAPAAAPSQPLANPAPQLDAEGSVTETPSAATNTTPALPAAAGTAPYGYQSPAPAAAPEAAPAPLGGGPIALIYFDENSVVLGQDDLDVIAKIVDLHKQYGGVLRIIGHASRETGSSEENRKISMDRANAIADALAGAGVPVEALMVAAAGDRATSGSEAQGSGADDPSLARRAEIFLTPY